MAFCKQCGKQNPDSAKFCTGCGNILVLNRPVTASVQQDDGHKQPEILQLKNKKKIFLIGGIIFLAAVSIVLYFVFLKKKKEFPVMMVLPESLKLRSSMSETGEDNVIRSAAYGTSVRILDSTDGWYKVETDRQKGYMHSRYLSSAKDFYETDAILKSAGLPDFPGAVKITESRFKKALFRYFRKQHYTANIPADVKEKYFKDEDWASKQVWGIKRGSAGALTVIKGHFTLSSKKGIAVIIQNSADPTKQKLLVFNYDDAENETGVSEFDEPDIVCIWLLEKQNFDYRDANGYYIKPGIDAVASATAEDIKFAQRNAALRMSQKRQHLVNSIPDEVRMGYTFYISRNGRMEKDFRPFDEELGD